MTETVTAVDDAQAADAEPVLVVLGAGGVERRPLPRRGRVVLGRAGDADVVLAEASVSRHHAALELADGLAIEDLASANGTSVRGTRIAGRVALGWGEAVQLGSLTILVMRDRRRVPAAPAGADGPVIIDPKLQRVVTVIERVARGELGVLLSGETGTGKEVLAELVHARSARSRGPFVRINCAAIPDGLVEAELFGHERGAFTGASSSRRGLIEEAAGGTLFLDEVGDLPLASQAKLLRVLEERTVRPVGGRAPVAVDVRVVAASNRDLRGEGFRSDLYFRLAGIVITVPPLRERPADVLPLAAHFLARAAVAAGRAAPALAAAAQDWLRAQSWPGNARELRNAIERAVLLCEGDTIEIAHLAGDASAADPAPNSTLRDALATVERERIRAVLDEHGWNRSKAARALGMTRNTLAARIKAYGLEPGPRHG
jgi:DNA-binding NtrC family response regulator